MPQRLAEERQVMFSDFRLGIERFAADHRLSIRWGRCGLVCNQASVTRDYTPSWRVAQSALGERLVTLFCPQH